MNAYNYYLATTINACNYYFWFKQKQWIAKRFKKRKKFSPVNNCILYADCWLWAQKLTGIEYLITTALTVIYSSYGVVVCYVLTFNWLGPHISTTFIMTNCSTSELIAFYLHILILIILKSHSTILYYIYNLQ